MELEGRAVVVTGGTGELGLAVVRRLAREGARVHVPARRPPAATLVADLGDRVTVTPGIDVADPAAVEGFYAALPPLWASIHCAGGFAMGEVAEVGEPDLRRMLETNAVSAFLCSRAAVTSMRRSGAGAGGRIVNVVSQQALDPRRGAGMTAYTMSKAAVAALTVALAEELASEGIWVNAVAPSLLDTHANRQAMPSADHARWPALDDVAETIAFLASPRNRVARGALVPVFGRT